MDCSDCPVLRNPIFQALPEEIRERTRCLFRPVELKPGMPLFIEGFPAHSVFAIRSGTAKAVRTSAQGREQVLRAFGDGEFVGLDALPLDRYESTVLAATHAVVCHAPRAVFVEVVLKSPPFAEAIIAHLCGELRRLRDALESIGTLGARGRVARLLLDQSDRDGRTFALPLSRRDTAGLLGLAEESLSRQISSLEHDGVLRRRGRRIEITDRDRLEQMSES